MTDYATPDEARAAANEQLAALYRDVTDWDTALLDQVLLAVAGDGQPFSTNDLRAVLPEGLLGKGTPGQYFHALVNREHPKVLEPVGEVRSVNPKARGKKVNTYELTPAGRVFIEERRDARKAARAEQRRAAA